MMYKYLGCQYSDYFRALLRGIGQVFFQENAWTGLFLLLGIALNAPTLALGAALGSGVATLLALWFDDAVGRARGLYGFNGALTGVAVLVFIAPHPGVWSLAILGAACTALMVRFWNRVCALPAYTAPFVLCTWALLYMADVLGLPAMASGGAQDSMGMPGAILRGVGQVFFQDNVWSGGVFLIALAVHSWRAAGWAVLAATLGMGCARLSGLPSDLIAMGLYGFNAVLAAEALRLALPGRYGIPSLLGVILSVVMTYAFHRMAVLSLTAPFILSTWVVVLLGQGIQADAIGSEQDGVQPNAIVRGEP